MITVNPELNQRLKDNLIPSSSIVFYQDRISYTIDEDEDLNDYEIDIFTSLARRLFKYMEDNGFDYDQIAERRINYSPIVDNSCTVYMKIFLVKKPNYPMISMFSWN